MNRHSSPTIKVLLGAATGGMLLCGIANAQPTAPPGLAAGRIEVRGSKDYREVVDAFLNGELKKIVGGAVAPAGAFPWQVSLAVSFIADASRAHFCGGSIFTPKWIITAAHCVDGNGAQDIHVIAGINRLARNSARENVKRIIQHKSYNASTQDNDIALLELLNPLELDDKVKPIVLLKGADETTLLDPGKTLTVSGWGATQEGGSTVKNLRFVDIPSVSRATCNLPPSYNGQITENMVCAGRALGGQDSCQGDSGGPLVTDRSGGSPVLAGIVSWGEGCAQPAKFGVYTRVTRYNDWIAQCVANPATCNN